MTGRWRRAVANLKVLSEYLVIPWSGSAGDVGPKRRKRARRSSPRSGDEITRGKLKQLIPVNLPGWRYRYLVVVESRSNAPQIPAQHPDETAVVKR